MAPGTSLHSPRIEEAKDCHSCPPLPHHSRGDVGQGHCLRPRSGGGSGESPRCCHGTDLASAPTCRLKSPEATTVSCAGGRGCPPGPCTQQRGVPAGAAGAPHPSGVGDVLRKAAGTQDTKMGGGGCSPTVAAATVLSQHHHPSCDHVRTLAFVLHFHTALLYRAMHLDALVSKRCDWESSGLGKLNGVGWRQD